MLELEIPKGIEVKVEGTKVIVKGKMGSTEKPFSKRYNSVAVENGKIIIESTKNDKLVKKAEKIEPALASEIKSAIDGVEKGFERNMQIVFAHFPMSLEVKGNKVILKNVFGEKIPREAKIVGTTKVEIKGQNVTVKGVDIYDVGQTVANITNACKIRNKDTRIFQDGIYEIKEV